MNFKSRILISLMVLFACSLACSDDDGGTETPTGNFSISNFELSDIENQGDGSDISVAYSISSDVSVLSEIRLIFSESPITVAEATALSGNQFTALDVASSGDINLSAAFRSSGNEFIEEDVTYQVYLLGVFSNSEITPILSSANPFSLKNETIVTTMELSGPFNGVEDVALAANGTLYVNGGGTSPSSLFKITPDGVSSVLSSGMDNAVGIAIDANGNVISSSFRSTTIYSTTPEGVTTPLVTDSRLTGGGGRFFDNNGNLYNAFFSQDVLFQIKDGAVSEFATSSSFNGPVGITYDKTRGHIYVSSFNTGSIYRVADDGSVTLIGDTPANIGHMSFANDHFFVTGWNQNQVYKLSLNGDIVETLGTGRTGDSDGPGNTAQFNQPNGIEVTDDGRYAYVSQGNGTMRRLIMARDN